MNDRRQQLRDAVWAAAFATLPYDNEERSARYAGELCRFRANRAVERFDTLPDTALPKEQDNG